jgi:biotin carboxylase
VRGSTLALDFRRPGRAAQQIAAFAQDYPLDAVVGVDDDTTVIAALAAERLGLPHNAVAAVRASRDKYRARQVWAAAGLPSPRFLRVALDADPAAAARRAPYPCVLKPVALAASRGVIRADDPAEFVEAFGRIKAMLGEGSGRRYLLVEAFVPGPEVALEGLLVGGTLHVLALFDKPDPLDGPYFEETLYVTPSRHPRAAQDAVAATAARAAAALGLREGPLHAELRLGGEGDTARIASGEGTRAAALRSSGAEGILAGAAPQRLGEGVPAGAGGPYVIEVAARSIGGLCSNALRFGTGLSLEEVILRHALAARDPTLGAEPVPERERRAAGALMLPIPRGGILRAVRGREEALAVPGVEEVTITIPLGQPVVPLPEGDRYLGFVFARADTPAEAEAALRLAHRRLRFVIAAPGEAWEDAVGLRAEPLWRRLLPVAPARPQDVGRR